VVVVTPLAEPIERAKPVVLIYCLAGINHAGVVEHHGVALMPQEQSQEIGVAPGFEVAGGEVVAEAVHQPVAGDPGPLLQALYHTGNRAGREPLTLVTQPQPLRALSGAVDKIAVQRFHRLALEGKHPHLRPFARNPHLLYGRVQVGEFDSGQLGKTHPGIGKHADDGLVAGAQEPRRLKLILATLQHGQHLAVGVGLDLTVVCPGQLQSPDAVIGHDLLLVRCPSEQPFYHPAVVVDRARAGRVVRGAGRVPVAPAILALAHIIEKLADVVPADEAGRLRPALFFGVPLEVFQAGLIVALGIRGQLPPADKEGGDKLGQGKGYFGSGCFGNHFAFFARPPLKKFSTPRCSILEFKLLDIQLLKPFSAHFRT